MRPHVGSNVASDSLSFTGYQFRMPFTGCCDLLLCSGLRAEVSHAFWLASFRSSRRGQSRLRACIVPALWGCPQGRGWSVISSRPVGWLPVPVSSGTEGSNPGRPGALCCRPPCRGQSRLRACMSIPFMFCGVSTFFTGSELGGPPRSCATLVGDIRS